MKRPLTVLLRVTLVFVMANAAYLAATENLARVRSS